MVYIKHPVYLFVYTKKKIRFISHTSKGEFSEYFLKGKIVLCNCDDPTWSNFWRYFHVNFTELGLKKLISTHYMYEGEELKGTDEYNEVSLLDVYNESVKQLLENSVSKS